MLALGQRNVSGDARCINNGAAAGFEHRGNFMLHRIAEISFRPNLAHLFQSILTGSNLAIEGDRFRASEIICQSLLSWHCWRCSIRRDGRVVDCTGLENQVTAW